MTNQTPATNYSPHQKKFIVITVLISLTVSLMFAEWALRYQRQSIEASDAMEPGMVLYDSRLGWKLKPLWSGRHYHHDFDVSYNINHAGFRKQIETGNRVHSNDYMVVGDSFTFGIGVEDKQTFTALLNQQDNLHHYNNLGVPGYSTDQEVLLVEKQARLKADDLEKNLLLIVYLGNDLFDNQRAFPLQADHGKPYFELHNQALLLKNVPVPLTQKTAAARKQTLTGIVLGEESKDNNLPDWLLNFELIRRTGVIKNEHRLTDADMSTRFQTQLTLFEALIDRLSKTIEDNNGHIQLVLLPGHSYVQQPDSLSAQYQDFFRRYIIEKFGQQRSTSVIDLATQLQKLHNNGVKDLYFPNEGHLSANGHKQVADFIISRLANSR